MDLPGADVCSALVGWSLIGNEKILRVAAEEDEVQGQRRDSSHGKERAEHGDESKLQRAAREEEEVGGGEGRGGGGQRKEEKKRMRKDKRMEEEQEG
eukprot:278719-Hanusia_phi.AAC.2